MKAESKEAKALPDRAKDEVFLSPTAKKIAAAVLVAGGAVALGVALKTFEATSVFQTLSFVTVVPAGYYFFKIDTIGDYEYRSPKVNRQWNIAFGAFALSTVALLVSYVHNWLEQGMNQTAESRASAAVIDQVKAGATTATICEPIKKGQDANDPSASGPCVKLKGEAKTVTTTHIVTEGPGEEATYFIVGDKTYKAVPYEPPAERTKAGSAKAPVPNP